MWTILGRETLETSGGQGYGLYLNVVQILTPVLIRYLWQLRTVVFLHWCLMHAVLFFRIAISSWLTSWSSSTRCWPTKTPTSCHLLLLAALFNFSSEPWFLIICPLCVFFLQFFKQLLAEFFFVFEELLMTRKAGVFVHDISCMTRHFQSTQAKSRVFVPDTQTRYFHMK